MGRHGAQETLLTQCAAQLTMPFSAISEGMLLGVGISVLRDVPFGKRTSSDFAIVIDATPMNVVVHAMIAMKSV
jgi:hypothetical protein